MIPEDFIHAEFNVGKLELLDLDADPFEQFARWYGHAQAAGIVDHAAMSLATCSPDGRPSARIVYLRGFDRRGFTFYTNYSSRKGCDLAHNPFAAICFYWKELERQIRMEGRVEKVSSEESDRYFAGRPPNTQLGAWASQQSEPLESGPLLQSRVEEFRRRFADQEIPRPPYWGGYRLSPDRFEFWQGRPSRLHDRFAYLLQSDGAWSITRLNP